MISNLSRVARTRTEPASQPAIIPTSGGSTGPAFSDNAEYQCTITDLLF